MLTNNKYVIYTRVSTKKQGDSGLGLEAQLQYINFFFKQTYKSDKDYTVVAHVQDVLSGTGQLEERPKLQEALRLCQENNAVLLVAKLDRLSRRVSVISKLMETVSFRVATMPNADEFQLHIYAALAAQEARFISERTKSALKVAKEKGVKLGAASEKYHRDPNTYKTTQQTKAHAKYEHLRNIFTIQVNKGTSPTHLTIKLNNLDIKTPNGTMWTPAQVIRVIGYLGLEHKYKRG